MNASLYEAAKAGNCDQIIHFLDMGANIDFQHPDHKKETPLFAALESGSEKAVSLLIRRGANVDVRNSDGLSPIHSASKQLSRDMVLELLKSGAKASPECLAVVKEQSESGKREETIELLQFGLRLTSFQAQYFLPMVYAVGCEKNLRRVKEELLVSFVNFEGLKVKKLIELAYVFDSNCHRHMPNILKLAARRYGLNSEQLTLICEDLKSDDLKDQAELSMRLAQVLRFSIEQGAAISDHVIVEVLQAIDSDQLRFELLSTIEILVRRNQADSLKSDHDEIKALAVELKHPLAEVLEAFGKDTDIRESKPSKRRTNFTLGSAGKSHPVSVSKQLHTEKTSQKNKQSQEEKIEITSLLDSMASKNKRKQKDRANQKTPSVQKRSGDSTGLLRTTYSQIIKFHEMLEEGKLTDDDINVYLQSKFLEDSKWFTGGAPANFLIDRLLCGMFKKASERYCLNAVTVGKLANCLSNNSSVKNHLFGTSDQDKIAASIMSDTSLTTRSYRLAPGPMGTVAEQLYEDLDKKVEKGWFSWLDTVKYFYSTNKVISLVDREIVKMRREAITAILNAAKFDRKVLTKATIKKVESCLSSSDREVARKAIQILGLLGDSSDVDYKALFAAHLRELQSTSNQADAQ